MSPLAPNKDTCQAGLYGLQQILQTLPPCAVAFSGGLDSRFLLLMLAKQGKDALAVHVTGPHMREKESRQAVKWLIEHSLPFTTVPFDPLSIAKVAANERDRCYHCKLHMFSAIKAAAPKRLILDGSNASDAREYRPGSQALEALGVVSPLAEAGLSKPMIQVLAAEQGLDRPSQPGRPCLLTRFPYAFTPTLDLLKRIEAAEDEVEELGFNDFRLRWLGDLALLQIAAREEELLEVKRAALLKILSKHGFDHADLETRVNISGFYDYPAES